MKPIFTTQTCSESSVLISNPYQLLSETLSSHLKTRTWCPVVEANLNLLGSFRLPVPRIQSHIFLFLVNTRRCTRFVGQSLVPERGACLERIQNWGDGRVIDFALGRGAG
jgi:hypothetical protein